MRASGERQTRLRRRSSLSDDGRLGGESEVGQDALDDGGVRKERESAPRATAVRADQHVGRPRTEIVGSGWAASGAVSKTRQMAWQRVMALVPRVGCAESCSGSDPDFECVRHRHTAWCARVDEQALQLDVDGE